MRPPPRHPRSRPRARRGPSRPGVRPQSPRRPPATTTAAPAHGPGSSSSSSSAPSSPASPAAASPAAGTSTRSATSTTTTREFSTAAPPTTPSRPPTSPRRKRSTAASPTTTTYSTSPTSRPRSTVETPNLPSSPTRRFFSAAHPPSYIPRLGSSFRFSCAPCAHYFFTKGRAHPRASDDVHKCPRLPAARTGEGTPFPPANPWRPLLSLMSLAPFPSIEVEWTARSTSSPTQRARRPADPSSKFDDARGGLSRLSAPT
mmetsp:Transcript_6459/g.19617  ORF Transcript_6459/g.19617 Transcript_6459/m.19617 type:complete len:259 (+) Transcript_6459:997-1773(+)